jgi:hypothetical protein
MFCTLPFVGGLAEHVGRDTLSERLAFIRSAPPRLLWLPPTVATTRPSAQRPPDTAPNRAAPGPVGRKAAVTFGNLDDIGVALRAARKARREDEDSPEMEVIQTLLFDR